MFQERWKTRNKNQYLLFNYIKGGDHMFDTKMFNLANISGFSPCVINLCGIVESDLIDLICNTDCFASM